MSREIERKFLVDTSKWSPAGPGTRLVQGYLASGRDRVVRVRLEGDQGRLTIKGSTVGITRSEYEYSIPPEDARDMLATLCERPLIDKTRHHESYAGRTWEVDVFRGENTGLVLAEIELDDPDAAIELPPWAGKDVSEDPRYFNSNLVRRPFSQWKT